jgi:hypothetical protein
MTFEAPAGQVVYEEDAARARALLGKPDYVTNTLPDGKTAALWWPGPVQNLPDADRFFTGSPNKGLMFLHERTTRGGRRVLVCGMVWPQGGLAGDVGLGVRAMQPATWEAGPQTGGGLWAVSPELRSYDGERRLRVFAGRPDPADVSHFTVEYETRWGHGVWDGWVRDNPAAAQGDNPVVIEFIPRPNDATR